MMNIKEVAEQIVAHLSGVTDQVEANLIAERYLNESLRAVAKTGAEGALRQFSTLDIKRVSLDSKTVKIDVALFKELQQQIGALFSCGQSTREDATWGYNVCRNCKRPLYMRNIGVADGCPCNAYRGVNHGLVPTFVCTCQECDPAQTGSAREFVSVSTKLH